MPSVVTINRPDVITLIEEVAAKMTGGNKTEAVALAMRKLLEREQRTALCLAATEARSSWPRALI